MKRKRWKRISFILFLVLLFLFAAMYVFHSLGAAKGREYYEETGQIIWDIKTDEKVVALTFDDGPHPKYTEQILDLLEQYEANGTFFIVGQLAEKSPELVLRMHESGHEIANHTYTHPYTKSVSPIMEEVNQTSDTIFSITGTKPNLFRPVEGYYTDELVKESVKNGYKIVMWSWHQDTEDWKNPGVNKIVKTVLNGLGNGNVVLFHDGGGNREQTVQALKKILPELKNQGYRFITISQMIRIQNDSNKHIVEEGK
ncbi:polysaccharide deacetylase family sporulation protein PdaB [Solibacillus kalamii]|uniref:Oligosaccharide deacetylase n=1 Tax=Solibacillus kalamii TaxID=1748298 RepID=A0ABX3ZJW9_9BACL|nr:polysaccharide deacetylase family protein [Solibacillus kalamii]MBM7664202.1 polysaccharide deacetylase family sporulation protein PdaB [Solibacillus kalamii]OUZ40032.1 oligosaccharide deacetylase [Solibacillus kalamii]